MNPEIKSELKKTLILKMNEKLEKYRPSTSYNPFLTGLIPIRYVRLNSFIISLSTSIGMSVYEQISKIIAESNGFTNCGKKTLYGTTTLSSMQISKTEEIIERLAKKGETADYELETNEINECDDTGGKKIKGNSVVDFSMEKEGITYFFEIKTAKPNKDVFIASKRKLLQWRARLKGQQLQTYLVFPYNPYHPNPYDHFAKGNLLERGREFLIGKEYWDFLGGEGTYEELIHLMNEVGQSLSQNIAIKIKQVKLAAFESNKKIDDFLN